MLNILKILKDLTKYLLLSEEQIKLVLFVSVLLMLFVVIFEFYVDSAPTRMLAISSYIYMCLLVKITNSFIKGFIYFMGIYSIYFLLLIIICGAISIKRRKT